MTTQVQTVSIRELHIRLGLPVPVTLPGGWEGRPLTDWKMAADDFVLRQVFRQARPARHLEFGTWLGDGVIRVVEECDATVWTINMPQGETKPDGQWAYGEMETAEAAAPQWAERHETFHGVWIRTDAYGLIGSKYLQGGWGKRVCQIYADSREWDTRAYPDGFFDTIFIDGGHTADVVENDARLAMRLVRPGGLVIWHDYCPREDVTAACDSTRDVVQYVESHREELDRSFDRLFWADPSWLLFGVRRG